MFLRILSIVFPIFIIVMIGFTYGRKRKPDMTAANGLNMAVFLPALIFSALAGKTFNLADNAALALGAVVVVVGSGLLAWPLARALGYAPKTFVPPVMFNNAGNMGLPLMALAFGPQALGAAVVLLLVETLLQFGLTPWLLQGRLHPAMIWREPVFAAAVVGMAVALGGWAVWPPVMSAAKLLGDISVGLMIFALGVRLATARLGSVGIGVAAAVATPLTGMAVAWAWGTAVGLGARELDMLVIFGALPPAVSNFIFAERYGQESDKVASMVLIGNAAAVVFVPLALALRL